MKFSSQWISAGTRTPFYVRKSFLISKKIKAAYADVCGLGQFVFYINGTKVSDHELDPGWSDYRKYIEYVTFDVTSCLHEGMNACAGEVGNGWYIKDDFHYTFHFPPFMPPNPNPYQPFGEALIFAMDLRLIYDDGSEEVLRSDESFKVHDHPVLHTNVYGSELYDASKAIEGWNTADFDDSCWENAEKAEKEPDCEMIEQFQPPVRVIHTYEGRYLHTVNDRRIYDFSQNASGMLEFEIKGTPGTKVCFDPAEKLDEAGNADQNAKGWMKIDNRIEYIIGSDSPETYRQKFSYTAGRFITVSSEGDYEILSIRLHSVTSAWKQAGTFDTDNEKYQKIFDMIERTVEANMVSVHTDCPTIERFAWQEPNHLMAPSVFFMKDGRKLWEKFLKDCRAAQHTADDTFFDFEGNRIPAGDGLVPSQAPCWVVNFLPVPGMGSFYDIIPWGSTVILGTKWHYEFYGDIQIIRDNFEAGVRYLQYLKTKINEEGFLNHGLGDWGNPENTLARENIETAFLYYDAVTLSEFARLLHSEKEDGLRRFAEEVKDNYNRKLLVQRENGTYAYRNYENKESISLTQACEALPLYFGMVPEQYKDDVIKAFKETLREKGSFVSGEIGLPYIIMTASKYGLNDLIAQFITKDTHPSYYAFVKDGMTTLGEYWENNPRSHCHDMMGHIIEWYYSAIAGIQIIEPGFRKISVHPWMPEDMNHFRCTYQTPYGLIEIEGNRKEGRPVFTVRVPKGIETEEN